MHWDAYRIGLSHEMHIPTAYETKVEKMIMGHIRILAIFPRLKVTLKQKLKSFS